MFAFFERLLDPFPPEDPARPPATLSAFVWHYCRPIWPHLLATCLLGAVIAVVEVTVFGFLGGIVDWLEGADKETFLADYGLRLALMAAVVVLVLPALTFVNELVVNQALMGNFPMRLRWLAHRYLLRQSVAFFQDDFAGRLATKVMQTALGVRDVLMRGTEIFVYVAVYFVSAVVLFARSDLRLSGALLLWLLGYAAVLRYFIPRLRDLAKEQADQRSAVTGRIVDAYTNIQTVKLFAHADREEGYARASMVPFLDNVYRQFRYVSTLNLLLELINGLLLFGVGLISVLLWLQGAVGAGAIALTVGLVLRLKGMSHWIMWELAGLVESIGTVQDGITTLSQDHGLVDAADARPLAVREGGIAFDHVRFHYGRERGVIEDLSLRIRPGEKVGLVGPSGAGKSTLLSLLLRFYDPEGGRVLIDGQDIARVTQESLRAAIGVVTQDTSLLHRSVRENIRYGRPDASDAEVERAVAQAHAAGFVDDLRDAKGRAGLDAHVGERGVKLSGGQRQRIAIARVLLKDAPILVLDEATSALDSEVEAAIQESLERLTRDKTVIAIAHRLSTIAAMDRLVVMEEGRIVEQGTHRELLEKNGVYARLWARQSGGFLDLDAAEGQAAE